MFLKKSLLFTTALALLMFAGQASAQDVVSLMHVPGADGTAGMVSGDDTEIVVEVSTTGNFSALVFVYNGDLLSLTGSDVAGATVLDQLGSIVLLGGNLPNSFQVTFTTDVDVTGQAFSIGINEASDATPPDALMFNGSTAPVDPVDPPVDPVDPPVDPPTDGVSLTSGGATIVRDIGAGAEIVVDIAVPAGMEETFGAEIEFAVNPAVAMITDVSVSPLQVLERDGTSIKIAGAPPEGRSSYGSVTFTTNADYDGAMFSIGVASFNTLTSSGRSSVAAGAPLMVNKPLPTLMGPDGDVMIMPGGSATAMVTAAGFDGTVTFDGAAEDGTVTASEPGEVTVTASDGIDPESASATINFVWGSLTLTADPEGAVTVMPGGTEMVTLTVSGQAEGAEVVFSEGATENEDGVSATVSASSAGTVTVTASVGDVMSNSVTIVFVPSLHTESTAVTFDDFGATASASVTAMGFPEGANIRFKITGGTGFAAADGAATWTVSTDKAGDVTVVAEDDMGNATAPLTISFVNPAPYLTADAADVIIPDGGEKVVTVTATGLGADVSWTVSEVTGTATVNIDTDGATATLMAMDSDDLSQTSTMTLVASDGSMTATTTVTFRKMPEVTTDMAAVDVPQAVVPAGSSMVMAVGFPPADEIAFSVEVTSGLESYVTYEQDGHVLTLTSTGTATVSVTASNGEVTTAAVEVSFTQALPAAPASVMVQDQEGDNGHYVMVTFANSENHGDVSQYRVYREMMVNDSEGNPVAEWVAWAVIDAMDNDGTTRAVVPVTDSKATRWGVAAESGMGSAEDVITPAGKRVFSKESVQELVQFLGLDPNWVVTEDELAEMFMPSADYINALIGDKKNVVFAALDPDLSVLIGGNVAVPQNIRTDHAGPIVSSPITPTEGIVAAVDDTAPVAVTGVAADAETGVVTWTVSADDGGMDVVMYRGYGIVIPHVTGYLVRGGVSEDAMLDIGVAPAGSGTFQVPMELIESLINQGVPAVLVTVTAMDGTNMTPSVPLVVELIPTRKAFVDEAGGPVYIVKLDRHGAMTPLTVDFEDFVAFTMAFNTDETHENWRVFVQADLNDDKMVNFDDFILFFGSYGKEAQGPAGKSLIPPPGVNEAAELSLRLGSDRVVAGETMFVDVSLANVQALMGYGFVLNYDAEKFEFVEAMPVAEDLLLSSGGETPLLRGWSPEAGQVHVMNAIVNGSEVSGGGDIVRLVFRVLRDFEDNARFEIAEGLVFDPSQLANPLAGGVLDIQTTPTEFALLQNFPNPFNPDTTIGYELAESADVTLQIYNVVGQVVRTLVAAEPQSVGRYQIRWDGMDDRGTPVSSGIYFYQLSAGKFQDVRKLMLLK